MTTQIVSLRDSLFTAITRFMDYLPALFGGVLVLVIGSKTHFDKLSSSP